MPRTVLIVDDSPTIRGFARIFLKQLPVDVQEAEEGMQALEMVRANPPDVIVVDINMPGMDGLAFTRELRSDPKIAAIPIVLLTGDRSEQIRQKGRDAGANVTNASSGPLVLTAALREATMGPENERPRRTDKPVQQGGPDAPAIDQPQQSWFNSGQGNVLVVLDATLSRDGAAVWRETVTGHAQSAPCVQAVDKVREALSDAVENLRARVIPLVRGP